MVTTARIATPTRVDREKTRAMLTSARGRRTERGRVSAATSAAVARARPGHGEHRPPAEYRQQPADAPGRR